MASHSRLNSLFISLTNSGVLLTLKYSLDLMLIKAGLKKYINVDGRKVFLRKGTSDLPVFRQIFMNKEYDFYVKKGAKYIVDLGANIGLASLYFKTKYKDAQVFAVELDKDNFLQMQKNLKDSFSDVNLIHAAIWPNDGYVTINNDKKLGEWGITVKDHHPVNGSGAEGIKCMTLNELMKTNRIPYIDILKVDIEGCESQIFSGADWLNSVRYIVIELHDSLYPACSNSFFKALSKLDKFNIGMKGENLIVENLSIQNQ